MFIFYRGAVSILVNIGLSSCDIYRPYIIMSDPMHGLQKLLQLIPTQPFVHQSWAHAWDLAPSVWSLQMVGSPVESSRLWRRGQLTSIYFCHLSPLRDIEGRSIHLSSSPDEAVCPEKKIARVTDTEDQWKECVAQSNEEYIWLKNREHGYCSLRQKIFQIIFSPEMQRHSLN